MENTLHILTHRVISCFNQWILLTAWPWTLTLVSWFSALKRVGEGAVLSTNRNWFLRMNEYTCPHLGLVISQLCWPLWILPGESSSSSSSNHSAMIFIWRTPLCLWIPTAWASIKKPKQFCQAASPPTVERVGLWPKLISSHSLTLAFVSWAE